MRCIWNIDERLTINMFLRDRFVRRPTKQQLAAEKAQSTEMIVLLLNSDLLSSTPLYNALQILLPCQNINVLLTEEQVITWLKQPANQMSKFVLSDADRQHLENFLAQFHPFHDVMKERADEKAN